jgi:hypothetical protein
MLPATVNSTARTAGGRGGEERRPAVRRRAPPAAGAVQKRVAPVWSAAALRQAQGISRDAALRQVGQLKSGAALRLSPHSKPAAIGWEAIDRRVVRQMGPCADRAGALDLELDMGMYWAETTPEPRTLNPPLARTGGFASASPVQACRRAPAEVPCGDKSVVTPPWGRVCCTPYDKCTFNRGAGGRGGGDY